MKHFAVETEGWPEVQINYVAWHSPLIEKFLRSVKFDLNGQLLYAGQIGDYKFRGIWRTISLMDDSPEGMSFIFRFKEEADAQAFSTAIKESA